MFLPRGHYSVFSSYSTPWYTCLLYFHIYSQDPRGSLQPFLRTVSADLRYTEPNLRMVSARMRRYSFGTKPEWKAFVHVPNDPNCPVSSPVLTPCSFSWDFLHYGFESVRCHWICQMLSRTKRKWACVVNISDIPSELLSSSSYTVSNVPYFIFLHHYKVH